MNTETLIAGGAGVTLSTIGTATQTNEVLQTISLIITIVGALVSFVIVPLLNWYKEAKNDGKIDADELADAAEKLSEGLEKTKHKIDDERKK